MSTTFYSFLEASTGFYSSLLAKLRAKYGISLEYGSLAAPADVDSASQSPASPSRPALTVFRILIRLGDLARYQRDAIGFADADWSASWAYYMDAQRLLPDQGMPYNQLAVLCTYAHDTIGALFFYSQSLALPVPSETGKSNIEVLMRDASLSNYIAAKRKYTESLRVPKRARALGDGQEAGSTAPASQSSSLSELWAVFAQGFLALHNASDAKSLDIALVEKDNILSDFESLVSNDWITDYPPSAVPGPHSPFSSTFLHLLLYNIFACWNVSQQPQTNESVRRLKLLLHFALSLLSIIMERASGDLQPSSSSQSASQALSASETSTGRLTLLPAIAIYLEWAASSAPHLVFDLTDESENNIFERLQASLSVFLSATLPYVVEASQSPKWKNSTTFSPLPEDLLLYPFLPLSEAHKAIDFTFKAHLSASRDALIRRCLKVFAFARTASRNPMFFAGFTAPVQDSFAQSETLFSTASHVRLLDARLLNEIESIVATFEGRSATSKSPLLPSSPAFNSQPLQSSIHHSPNRSVPAGSLSSIGSQDSALGLLADQAALYGTSSASIPASSVPHSLFPKAAAPVVPSGAAISRPRNLFSDSAIDDDSASHPLPDAQVLSSASEEHGGYDPWGQNNGSAMHVDDSPRDSGSLPAPSIMTSGAAVFNPFLFPPAAAIPSPQPSQLGMMAQGVQPHTRNSSIPFAFPSNATNSHTDSHSAS